MHQSVAKYVCEIKLKQKNAVFSRKSPQCFGHRPLSIAQLTGIATRGQQPRKWQLTAESPSGQRYLSVITQSVIAYAWSAMLHTTVTAPVVALAFDTVTVHVI